MNGTWYDLVQPVAGGSVYVVEIVGSEQRWGSTNYGHALWRGSFLPDGTWLPSVWHHMDEATARLVLAAHLGSKETPMKYRFIEFWRKPDGELAVLRWEYKQQWKESRMRSLTERRASVWEYLGSVIDGVAMPPLTDEFDPATLALLIATQQDD